MTWKIALAAIGLVALGAVPSASARSPMEPAADKPARACFWTRSVNGFAAADDRIVYLRVGVRDVYELQMLGPCYDLDWANAIGIRNRSGSGRVCTGLDADIISPSLSGPQRCPVRTVRKLTLTEAAALPKGSQP